MTQQMRLSDRHFRERIKMYDEVDSRIGHLANHVNISRDQQKKMREIAHDACREAMRIGVNMGRARAKGRIPPIRRVGVARR